MFFREYIAPSPGLEVEVRIRRFAQRATTRAAEENGMYWHCTFRRTPSGVHNIKG